MPMFRSLPRHAARALRANTSSRHDQSAWSKDELLARLRGEQTIRRMREQGLCAPDPFYMASNVLVDPGFAWAIQIGASATISFDVRIIAHDSTMYNLTGYTVVRPVKIGTKCYVGAGTTILPGAVIGEGAVIGAGSVVTGEIPDGAVAAGNPARVIGTIDELRKRHLKDMSEIPRFEKGPAEPGGLTNSELDAMKRALETHGRFYVR